MTKTEKIKQEFYEYCFYKLNVPLLNFNKCANNLADILCRKEGISRDLRKLSTWQNALNLLDKYDSAYLRHLALNYEPHKEPEQYEPVSKSYCLHNK